MKNALTVDSDELFVWKLDSSLAGIRQAQIRKKIEKSHVNKKLSIFLFDRSEKKHPVSYYIISYRHHTVSYHNLKVPYVIMTKTLLKRDTHTQQSTPPPHTLCHHLSSFFDLRHSLTTHTHPKNDEYINLWTLSNWLTSEHWSRTNFELFSNKRWTFEMTKEWSKARKPNSSIDVEIQLRIAAMFFGLFTDYQNNKNTSPPRGWLLGGFQISMRKSERISIASHLKYGVICTLFSMRFIIWAIRTFTPTDSAILFKLSQQAA